MSSSKKGKRKQPEVSRDEYLEFSKGKALDTSLQITGTISKNKNGAHESPLESDPASELPVKQTAENHVELCGVHKKLERKKKRSKARENNDPITYKKKNNDPGQNPVEENLRMVEGKCFDPSFQNTKTVSEIKNEVHGTTSQGVSNLELTVNRNLGTASQIAENHAEMSSAQRKIKRRKKRCDDPENKNLGEKPLETGSLCSSDVTNLEQLENSELDSIRNKKNHEALMGNNLITVEPSILSKCARTKSMKKNDVSTEINVTSIEVERLNMCRRKTEKLFRLSKSIELGKRKSASTSLQVVQNSSMGEACVNCSDTTLASVESKGRIKSKNVKNEDELNVVQKVVLEIGHSEEENMEKSPKILLVSSENKLEKVKEVKPVSSRVAQNNSTGALEIGFSEEENLEKLPKILSVSSENKLEKVKEVIPVSSRIAQNSSTGALEIGLSEEENMEKPPKILSVSSENKLEKVKEVKPVSSRVAQNSSTGALEIGVSEEENMEKPPKILSVSSENKLEIVKEVKPVSLRVAQNSSTGDVSADCSDNKLVLGKIERKAKMKLTIHGDKSRKDISGVKLSDEHLLQENKGALNTEESPTDQEDRSFSFPETGDIVKHVCSRKLEVINKKGTPSELCQEGCSISSSAVENVSIGESRRYRRRVKSTIYEGKSSDDTSACDPVPKRPEHLLRVHYDFGEENPVVEISCVSGEENQEVSLSESNKKEIAHSSTEDVIKDGVIKKEDNPLEMLSKEGCGSLLPAVENISIGTYSANCSDRRPASGRSEFREKKVESSVDEYKASDDTFVCDPSSKHQEDPQECCDVGENKFEMEASCPFGEEKLEVSFNECQMEKKTLSFNENAIKDAPTREDNPLDSPERGPSVLSRRKLLILDLNGLLADIVSYTPDGYKADKTIGQKALFKRPFCRDFLKFCFERFNVGVWSSRTKRNVDSVVDFLMGHMKQKLLFCWDQSHCTGTGFSTVDNRQKPLVLKELRKLWDKHEPNLPWEKGEYNGSNTLLLDDSPYKALRNPLHTAVFPSAYRFRDTDDNSLGPGGDIRVYLEGLATAEDVQKYVEKHPFGQRAITDKNPSWGYYSRVIGNDNSCLQT